MNHPKGMTILRTAVVHQTDRECDHGFSTGNAMGCALSMPFASSEVLGTNAWS